MAAAEPGASAALTVRPRPASLGIAALALAAVCIALPRALALLARWFAFFQAPSQPAAFYWPAWAQTAALLVALVLGVVAAVTGRGRWYGLAAVLLAAVGSELLPLAVFWEMNSLRG